jgi:hypothetical protein
VINPRVIDCGNEGCMQRYAMTGFEIRGIKPSGSATR